MKYKIFFLILSLFLISCKNNDLKKDLSEIINLNLKNSTEKFLTAEESLKSFLKFYNEKQISGLDREKNEDMLLFQINITDENIEVDFTRQYTVKFFLIGESLKQIHLTLFYDKKILSNKKSESAVIWLDNETDSNQWKNKIEKNDLYKLLKKIKPLNYEINEDMTE